jgi:hypothetical protein
MWRYAVVVGLIAVGLAGCGSSGSTSSPSTAASTGSVASSAPRGWTGLGAKLTDWESAHPKATESCAEGCYGSKVQLAPGESQYEFTSLSTGGDTNNRVTGYSQALMEGTSIAAAKVAVLRLLPRDTRTIELWTDHENGSCLIWNVRSATLDRWFAANPKIGDRSGVMGIDLHTTSAGGESEYKPSNVTVAGVGVGATHRGISC